MIEWAEKQRPHDSCNRFNMYRELAEDWGGSFCPICRYFMKYDNCSENCPIYQKTGYRHCRGIPWYNMNESITWGVG